MRKEIGLKLTIRLLDEDGQRCFGPGVATLLEAIREHHSLRSAAASMNMAYSKAWRIVHTAEDGLHCKLLTSTIGGQHGGGAALTEEAEQLLEAYRSYQEDLRNYAEKRFGDFFSFPIR